ncbi:ferric reductase-like transmembrane domain-containing protein [uncultured Sulfitobacter sp.]|uniref:sulfite oxidase heme-binding subunit YedZ n=1 Tax=uncultured Sulfitobacter sp. TaxID=191468 RepID=UPI0026283301|nr:ferric reductase-like transmembrane domain-containing protein [uncultured Sulfitobacter sp.]
MKPRTSRTTPIVWLCLALPAISWGVTFTQQGAIIADDVLNPTGALSAILFILALTATPLRYVWPRGVFTVWLLRNRRYQGIASFGYALLHTLFYLLDAGSLSKVVSQLPILEIWTGWISLLIMVPLAFTSSDVAVRKLGRQWKKLQRWAYAAAVLGLLHALSLNNWEDPWEPMIVSAPLIVLQVLRLKRKITTRRTSA